MNNFDPGQEISASRYYSHQDSNAMMGAVGNYHYPMISSSDYQPMGGHPGQASSQNRNVNVQDRTVGRNSMLRGSSSYHPWRSEERISPSKKNTKPHSVLLV